MRTSEQVASLARSWDRGGRGKKVVFGARLKSDLSTDVEAGA